MLKSSVFYNLFINNFFNSFHSISLGTTPLQATILSEENKIGYLTENDAF